MKKISLLLLLLISILLTGCGEDIETTSVEKVKAVDTLDLNMTKAYQMYVEQTLSRRVIAFKLFENVVDKDPLSGNDLDAIHIMLEHYLESKAETALHVNEYQYLLSYDDEEYTQKEELELVMMSLAAMLLRYDDYLVTYSKYDENGKLNVVLNAADSAYSIPENTLENDILLNYELASDRNTINSMISYYNDNIRNYTEDTNSYFLYLKMLIGDSPTYKFGFQEESLIDDFFDWISDLGDDLFGGFFTTLSENIGNTAGLVEIREGMLYNNIKVAAAVRENIQSGDILVERTPFRLTDKLIPGYFGHIAVYLGTENELKEMGIWDDLNVSYNDENRTYQDDVLEDKLIVEALRDGVQLNSVEHFLNVDDLAIMHDNSEIFEDRTARIKRVISQLGKEYDFEYDIEDNSKIVCSELVYITSLNIDWDTSSTVGINTISPDNVAIISTYQDTVFTIPLMYHDGELITSDEKEYMTQILEEYEE